MKIPSQPGNRHQGFPSRYAQTEETEEEALLHTPSRLHRLPLLLHARCMVAAAAAAAAAVEVQIENDREKGKWAGALECALIELHYKVDVQCSMFNAYSQRTAESGADNSDRDRRAEGDPNEGQRRKESRTNIGQGRTGRTKSGCGVILERMQRDAVRERERPRARVGELTGLASSVKNKKKKQLQHEDRDGVGTGCCQAEGTEEGQKMRPARRGHSAGRDICPQRSHLTLSA